MADKPQDIFGNALSGDVIYKPNQSSYKKKDKCGFGCKIKKAVSQTISTHREKKAKSYGYDSYDAWSKAAKDAEKRGYTKAGKKRLKEIEDRASGKNIAGGPSNLSKGISLFDEFMGTPQKKKRTTSKRKKSTGYSKRKSSTRKRTSKEEPFFTF